LASANVNHAGCSPLPMKIASLVSVVVSVVVGIAWPLGSLGSSGGVVLPCYSRA